MISSMRGGGSEQQTLLLLQHLDRSRFEPQLYLTERAGDLLARVPDDVHIHAYSDAPRVGERYFPGRELRAQTGYVSEVLRREAIDVIYDRTFHMTLLAGPAGRRCNVPRISTIVSPPEWAVPLVENRFVWIKRKRLARAYRQSYRVIAVSQQAADSAERYYGLAGGSTDVIRNPVDRQRLELCSRQSPPTRDDRLTLVCVGRMSEEKGHRDLLTAISMLQPKWPADLNPIRLWLIGDGPLRSSLQAQWAPHREGTHEVEFLGVQSNPAPFIKAADALVLPSHFEGMPNVVLEAMALGTPVIATRVGGTTELQREAPTILWTEPCQPDSLANAILEFARHREAAAQRSQNARQMIEEHHDVTKCVARIEARLLQACEQRVGS